MTDNKHNQRMGTPPHLGGHMGRTHIDKGALSYFLGCGMLSMVDIGCGPGGQVDEARKMGIAARGIDGDPNVDPGILHDFTREPFYPDETFDLGWSVEFLEHVEERYLPNVAPIMEACRFLCITHALPGKSGHHHVNCQPQEYWRDWFDSLGFDFKPQLTQGVKESSTMEREFIATTGMVFERRD